VFFNAAPPALQNLPASSPDKQAKKKRPSRPWPRSQRELSMSRKLLAFGQVRPRRAHLTRPAHIALH
jgi:hypothetical protein